MIWRGLYAAFAAALVVALVACERKAPGPEECGWLAERWVRQSMPAPVAPSAAVVVSSVNGI